MRSPVRSAPGVPFATTLRAHGDRLAVVTPHGAELTYDQLAGRVEDAAARLGTDRRLVMIAAANDLEPLVTYLAALAAGHPVLLTAPDDRHWNTLLSIYDPDVVLRREDEWTLRERRDGTCHDLHPDLALLLSTSGSTGSPKLVRLSAENLQANAESIARFLDIRDSDRASAALPMHYCYGLSIINSNLLRGAALLLTEDSVVDPAFWATFQKYRGTSLHGVPYTFDLLERVGFDRIHLPSLRYVTQAGGALPAHRVRHIAELGRRRGWRLFVMYGQTEATARMAYLPPELAESHPSAIGVPIPGGSFEILPSEDPSTPGQGELVYRGPNVMFGYAESPADLALGATIDALATGDIARRTADGLYVVVGRTSRFVKLFGLRIDLCQVELLLADHGRTCACAGTDDALTIATLSPDRYAIRRLVQERLRLPADRIRVVAVDELPRLTNGKIDYSAIQELANSQDLRPARHTDLSVRECFAKVLGCADIADDATFVDLGGDSLSYVQMSLEIERTLGYLPDDWPTTPIGELDRLAAQHDGRAERTTVTRTTTVETGIVLRAVAIILIVSNHIGLFHILGGAHLLLIVAGWGFARFRLAPRDSGTSHAILRSAARIAIPSMLWLTWRAVESTSVGWSNVLLINNYVRHGAYGYWFVEVLVQTLLLFTLVFAIPAARRWERRHGFGFALATLGVALLAHQFAHDTNTFAERWMATHGVVWFFVLGWLGYRATRTRQKALVVAITLLMIPGYFANPLRETVITVGFAALLFLPRLALPRFVVRMTGSIASASLYIYLTHYAVYSAALPHLPALAVLLLCLGTGMLTWSATQTLRRAVRLLAQRVRTSSRDHDTVVGSGREAQVQALSGADGTVALAKSAVATADQS
ncbi:MULTISPECIES: AMP-binding protein [Protofrankia]|uniref:AMP-binding protein n=1 Tax=Protofrankia TaxID=2994361 RepID=UPI000A7EED6C|nr:MULTISPECIES: AMP-binding protein [Protofrankia]